jgi:hypothetical protein
MGSKLWVSLGVSALLACGGNDQQANAPACPPGQVFDGRYCQMQTAPPPAPTSAGGTGAGGSPSGVPPAPPLPLATTSCAAPVTLIDVSSAQAVTGALLPLAAQKAMPGAKPAGAPIAAQFQQGQCAEITVNMAPGKCYSVVGAALPTVQNLDLALVPSVALPGLPLAIAAADNSTGPSAVLGENPNCFKWPLPVSGTMKLIVGVSAGQGLAAAQVFEK